MTRSFIVVAAVSAALAWPGQEPLAPKYGVTVVAEKGVDFSRFITYSWTPGQPANLRTIDAQIVAAVDRELKALGMSRVPPGGGDVLATYFSLTRTDVDLNARADDTGLRPEQSVGTLIVALLDPGTRRRLLQLRTDRPIDTSPAGLEADINRAVTELFEKYPTRTAK
jgi:hypothetical protein